MIVERPWVTVVIPTYGRQQLVDRAVASVAAARGNHAVEVVVVDDASPEPIRVSVLGANLARVVRLETNQGPGAARNAGIEAARGEFVSFLDSDDAYTKDRFDRVAEAIAGAPKHDLYLCWARFEDDSPREGRLLEGNVHDVILERTAPHLGTVTARRSAIVPFDPTFRACQDLEWWLRISASHRVHTIAAIGYVLGRHDGPRHGNGKRARIEYSNRLLQDYAPYFGRHPRARGFRLYRMARLALQLDEFSDARRYAWEAATSDRTFLPRSAAVWLRSWARVPGATTHASPGEG